MQNKALIHFNEPTEQRLYIYVYIDGKLIKLYIKPYFYNAEIIFEMSNMLMNKMKL